MPEIIIKEPKKAKAHYVDNQKFLQALVDHKKLVTKAKKLGQEKPRLPEYVGECILKIANHLSFRPNFLNYPFREDMVGDGIENCLNYVDNFNPSKSKNPFAYFTQILFYAFVRRITKEKKQMIIKYKAIQNSPYFEDMTRQVGDEGGSGDNAYINFIKKNIGTMVSDFDEKKKAKKALKIKKNNLEKLIA